MGYRAILRLKVIKGCRSLIETDGRYSMDALGWMDE